MGTGRSVYDWQRNLAVVLGCLFSCCLLWWNDQQRKSSEVKHSSPQFDVAIDSMMGRPWKVSSDSMADSVRDVASNKMLTSEALEETLPTPAPAPKVRQWPSLESCEARYRDPSSRPGRPCLPRPENPPYRTDSYSKKVLGERTYLASIGVIEESDCEGWRLFGDMTWCKRAFLSREGNEQPDGSVIGLSYGIEQRDLWSELVSNDYGVPTKLFDCYQKPEDSPPLGGKAVNGSSCEGVSGHCYAVPYQAFRICLGGAVKETTKRDGRRFESLQMHLKSRHRLSVHLKIDTEGAEWEELEWLVSSPSEMDKIRTFDMEVHIGWLSATASPERRSMTPKERISRDISTLEALGKYFRCTGSSMEVLAEEWSRREDGGRCRPRSCPEPEAHTATGFSVIQFAISFVHPNLLKTGPKPVPVWPPLPSTNSVDESQTSWPCVRPHTNSGSRPGVPCLPILRPLPYSTQQTDRVELGGRIVKAAAGLSDKNCNFQLIGDTTWCTQAFPTDTKNVIGLSYGVGGRDLWSERLSEAKILTRLYDCEAKSLSASNGTKPCSNVGPKSVPCYATPYELYHTCITAGGTSPFEAVQQHLSNRDPLSVHMKIDLGSASLDLLEWIRTSGEVGKLRTLDITLQVGASRSGSKSTGTEQIIKDIETLEGFRELMQLSGSSLEFMAEQWLKLRTCASQCEEPPVYSPGGVPLNQAFSLSFIHGDLLS